MMRALLVVAALAGLTACGEQPQSMKENAKQDTSAFKGTGSAFTVPGWTPGNETSWEAQLKTRTQNGQNDYTKVN